MIKTLTIRSHRQGLIEFTEDINSLVARSNLACGLCTLFILHTSASLLIQENADASAKKDLENWLARMVPEHDPLYTHIAEGSDDMPAHVKSMLTQSSLSIPIENSRLTLGAWQGIYLFEHRRGDHNRLVKVHLLSG